MPTLIVPCPHCQQRAQLDSDKLPDQPAYFPCPHCKQKVVVDKRKLLQDQAAAAPPAPPAAPAAGPAQGSMPASVPLPASASADRRFGRLPSDARFPSGIIGGDDPATIETIRTRLAAVGSEVEVVDSLEDARSIVTNESPDLCIIVTAGPLTPPHAPLTPLTELPANIRRRTYLALVGDELRTLDGTAAFMFNVNMVLGKQDLEQFEAALYSGTQYHERLYGPYFQAEERRRAG